MATSTSSSKQAEDLMGKAKDAAGNAYDRAKEGAGIVADKAKDAARTVGKQAEDATHGVGRGIESLAGTMRDNLPKDGVIGATSSKVADGLEATGHYLEQQGLSGMAKDVTNVIRNNPIPAVLVGIGLGFLLARVTSSRS